MFDPLTLNCHSIVNKFTDCIFWWTDEQMFLSIWIDEIGKNEDKSINETSASLISTDWSIQSISIKSDLPIFIDLSIDISIPIFIDWSRPLRVICTGRTVSNFFFWLWTFYFSILTDELLSAHVMGLRVHITQTLRDNNSSPEPSNHLMAAQ